MSAVTETELVSSPEPSAETGRYENGMTREQAEEFIAAIGRRKNDPEYVKRLMEGVEEYRRQLQEEFERELAETEAK